MKNKSFATLGLLALLTATSAFGQWSQRVEIPFEFRVATALLPAGHYDVDRLVEGHPGLLSLRCYEHPARTFTLTNPGGNYDQRTKNRLVFTRYGETYFLSEVWTSDSREGSLLPKSKAEREIAAGSATLAQTSQVVLVARP